VWTAAEWRDDPIQLDIAQRRVSSYLGEVREQKGTQAIGNRSPTDGKHPRLKPRLNRVKTDATIDVDIGQHMRADDQDAIILA
jgi:hypothetical protein